MSLSTIATEGLLPPSLKAIATEGFLSAEVATVGVKHYRKKIVEDDLDKFLLPWEIEDKNKTVIVEKQKTGKFAKKQVIVHNTLEAEYITELKAEQKRKRRKKAIAMLLESL